MSRMRGQGRKPKPTKIKKITGNPGCRKLNEHEPKPQDGVAICPGYFDEIAKGAFESAVSDLEYMHIKTASFQKQLEIYASAYSDWRQLSAVIEQKGRTFETTTQAGDTMYRSRPEVAQRNEAWKQVKASLSELGLTPTAISRLNAQVSSAIESEIDKILD
ncbi:P27 family phage terminase small subunit [Piscirickettsia salmonis]|uniref:P27 family phage terminase small subunit n=1 Tax=Piscirickettsia salmonis TaxID=1238 RepID=UPI0009D7485A|nr:P27 family phage terminase small subunit [Piscirickettsia salmonis]